MSNRLHDIGKHEIEVMYILKPIIDKNLSIINILVVNIYFLSITLVGYISIKKITKFTTILIENFVSINKFFISSFVIGSIIFNGFLES